MPPWDEQPQQPLKSTLIRKSAEDSSAHPTKTPANATAARRAKNGHSMVERRYRENLNAKIGHLRQALLNTKSLAEDSDGSPVLEESTNGPAKTKKADVLVDAIVYVSRSEQEKKSMMTENSFLKLRIVALEKLIKCENCSLLTQMNALRVEANNAGRY